MWVDDSLPASIRQLFAEAQRLGRDFVVGRVITQRPSRVAVVRRILVEPLPTERVRACSCGGWLELRAGLVKPVHVGPAVCRR